MIALVLGTVCVLSWAGGGSANYVHNHPSSAIGKMLRGHDPELLHYRHPSVPFTMNMTPVADHSPNEFRHAFLARHPIDGSFAYIRYHVHVPESLVLLDYVPELLAVRCVAHILDLQMTNTKVVSDWAIGAPLVGSPMWGCPREQQKGEEVEDPWQLAAPFYRRIRGIVIRSKTKAMIFTEPLHFAEVFEHALITTSLFNGRYAKQRLLHGQAMDEHGKLATHHRRSVVRDMQQRVDEGTEGAPPLDTQFVLGDEHHLPPLSHLENDPHTALHLEMGHGPDVDEIMDGLRAQGHDIHPDSPTSRRLLGAKRAGRRSRRKAGESMWKLQSEGDLEEEIHEMARQIAMQTVDRHVRTAREAKAKGEGGHGHGQGHSHDDDLGMSAVDGEGTDTAHGSLRMKRTLTDIKRLTTDTESVSEGAGVAFDDFDAPAMHEPPASSDVAQNSTVSQSPWTISPEFAKHLPSSLPRHGPTPELEDASRRQARFRRSQTSLQTKSDWTAMETVITGVNVKEDGSVDEASIPIISISGKVILTDEVNIRGESGGANMVESKIKIFDWPQRVLNFPIPNNLINEAGYSAGMAMKVDVTCDECYVKEETMLEMTIETSWLSFRSMKKTMTTTREEQEKTVLKGTIEIDLTPPRWSIVTQWHEFFQFTFMVSVVPITFSVQARFEASIGTFQLSFEGNAVTGFKSGYTEVKGVECVLSEQPKVLEPVIKDEYDEAIKEFPAKITFLFKMTFLGVARAFFMVARIPIFGSAVFEGGIDGALSADFIIKISIGAGGALPCKEGKEKPDKYFFVFEPTLEVKFKVSLFLRLPWLENDMFDGGPGSSAPEGTPAPSEHDQSLYPTPKDDIGGYGFSWEIYSISIIPWEDMTMSIAITKLLYGSSDPGFVEKVEKGEEDPVPMLCFGIADDPPPEHQECMNANRVIGKCQGEMEGYQANWNPARICQVLIAQGAGNVASGAEFDQRCLGVLGTLCQSQCESLKDLWGNPQASTGYALEMDGCLSKIGEGASPTEDPLQPCESEPPEETTFTPLEPKEVEPDSGPPPVLNPNDEEVESSLCAPPHCEAPPTVSFAEAQALIKSAKEAEVRGEVVEIPTLVPKVVNVTPWLVIGWWFDEDGVLHYDRMIQRGGYSYVVQVPERWV